MAAELRKTGISVVGDMPWGTHFCYFYETKQDLLDILVPYFKAGLENNEFCLWVISPPLTLEEVINALRKVVPDLDRHLMERSIEILPHDEWYFKEGVLDLSRVITGWNEKLNEALARGYEGMRVSGNKGWIQKEGWREFRDYEKELAVLLEDKRMIVLCHYLLAKHTAAEVLDVARNHLFTIARRYGNWEVLETPELIQAKQEMMSLNEKLEQRVIERTRELAATNEKLRREISERTRAEEALRRSEDHLRLVIDAIPTMAWSLGSDGIVDFLNQRWVDYTGLSLEQFIEEPTRPIHSEDIPRVVERWRAEMAVGEPYDDEMRLQRADGEYRWFLVRTAPLRDERGNLVKWYGVSIDIEERKRAEEQLSATNVQLRALSESLRSAREQEGARIAREIHDELGAALMSLKWGLEELDKTFAEAGDQAQLAARREKTAAMMKLIDNTINVVRRIAAELRPSILDDLGLVEAIEWQAQKFQAQTGIVCRCDCSLEDVELSQDQSTAVFRIFQEALTNILRHAQATSVDITMRKENGELILTISDNGRGIMEDEEAGRLSLGILGMRERAHLAGGRIDITGVKGEGTEVIVRVPISG
jgi:PAS domain S-box-containing protein